MGKISEQIVHQRRYIDGMQTSDKMFSIIIQEMLLIATMKQHSTPVIRLRKIKNKLSYKSSENLELLEFSFIDDGMAKCYSCSERQFGGFLQNSTYTYQIIKQTKLHGIYLKELKNDHTETYTWMFIAALFIISKTQKQPRLPSVGE